MRMKKYKPDCMDGYVPYFEVYMKHTDKGRAMMIHHSIGAEQVTIKEFIFDLQQFITALINRKTKYIDTWKDRPKKNKK
jgi:hypothetical protein